jgi:hypothetical protein
LTIIERETVLTHLLSDRFIDKAVAQVWATLLDEGTYLCSLSTMHRIYYGNIMLPKSGDALPLIHHGRNQNWWLTDPVRSGHGTSPCSKVRVAVSGITFTS